MKNKLRNIVFIMVLVCSILTMVANAASFTATMTPSANTVKEATEFTITVKVSNLDVGANGINSLEGYLKYDTAIFETISQSSIEGLNNWSPKFDETNGKISLTKNTFVTSSQEVFQITFKTKSGVVGKKGNISYSDIVASNSESNISATDISTSITIGEASATNTNSVTINPIANLSNNTVNNNVVTNNTANNTTNNSISSYVNTMTNTVSESNMPQTGVNDTILVVIFVIIAVAIVFYVKIEKLNKDL